jgi:hypothetical protein
VVLEFDDLTSLRAAIAYANNHPGPETIIFDPVVFGNSRRAITLKGSPLVVTGSEAVTIIGPGADLLKISGGGKSRVFDFEGGALALEGMTITGGRADRGGGPGGPGVQAAQPAVSATTVSFALWFGRVYLAFAGATGFRISSNSFRRPRATSGWPRSS